MKRLKTPKVGMLAAMAGMLVLALGTPALASTGQSGPTPPKVGDPVSGLAEVQRVQIVTGNAGAPCRLTTPPTGTCLPDGDPSGGSITLTVGGTTTGPLTWASGRGPSEGSVETAIEAAMVTAFSGGAANNDATVYGLRGYSYMVIFNRVGPVGDAVNVAQMTGSAASLTGPDPAGYAVVVTTAEEGAGAVTGQVAPHNGFSSTTNFCVQCHAVHSYQVPGSSPATFVGPGDYALLQGNSVTSTCNTCHGLFGTAETGRVDSDAITGKPAVTGGMGTTSMRSAYDVASPVSSHALGADTSPLPDGTTMYELGWGYGGFNAARWYSENSAAGPGTADVADGGLYCGSCHTPHGEFGQLINSKVYRSQAVTTAVNAVQYIDARSLTAGDTYRLRLFGTTGTTALITAPSTFGGVDGVLEGLLGAGTVAVTNAYSTVPGYFRVEFTGSMGNTQVAQLEATDTTFADPASAVTVITQFGGSDGTAGSLGDGPRTWADDAPILESTTVRYLNLPASGVWQKCVTVDTNCSDLVTTDSEGQTVYLYGYKLLSAYPNHQWLKGESWGVGSRGNDQARWCGTCHMSKIGLNLGVVGEFAVGGTTYHSHPTACSYCHGNPANGASFDFPHTSTNGALLKEYPDALCISCHTSGSLP